MRLPGRTPPFRGPDGGALPNSTAETAYLRLGGHAFEVSGHEPFVDEPAKFNASMLELVRPVIA